MFSHITVGTNDVERSLAFYDAALAPLGIKRHKTVKIGAGYAPINHQKGELPFWVLRPFDRQPAHRGNGWHAAFLASNRSAVDAFYAAAMAAGGQDEGGPGLRPHYHANYYAAYVRDPDGNKIQAVCHDPAD